MACVAYPITKEEMILATEFLKQEGRDCVVLGACTNTLISDRGFDGAAVSTDMLKGKSVCGDRIYLSAGEKMSAVCRYALENSLSGIEGLCSIPGSVGGGLAMNCGAFGRELADVVEYVDLLIDGKVERVYAKDLDFAYRHSKVKELGVAIGASVKLAAGNKNRIAKDMKGYAIARGKSQPKGKSLGSVFKKAGDGSAGYYIDRAGLKGYRIGGAQISQMHANFIINTGGATSADFLRLADYARQEVDKRFGVKLKYEIEYLSAVSSTEHI